jgi:putative FmdB family regulatory protein
VEVDFMPLFNYKCRNCDNSFEELVRSCSDKVTCPKCGSELVEKKLPNRLNSSSSASSSHGSGCG